MSRYFLWEFRMLVVAELLLLMLKILPKTPETVPAISAFIDLAKTMHVRRIK